MHACMSVCVVCVRERVCMNEVCEKFCLCACRVSEKKPAYMYV